MSEAIVPTDPMADAMRREDIARRSYYGDEAVNMAAKANGYKGVIDPVARHLIHEEGFVEGAYADDVGVKTRGVGQTGEWMGKNLFTEVIPHFENKSRKVVPGYDELPDNVRGAILSAVYRGDLSKDHDTAKLLRAGKGAEAADEYLNHAEYKERLAKNPEDGVVKRMQRNAANFRTIGQE